MSIYSPPPIKTTVSRAINNSEYVKQETKKRIEETIKNLGYKPLERSGGAKATKTFGLIVPNIENPFYGKMANHLSSVAMLWQLYNAKRF